MSAAALRSQQDHDACFLCPVHHSRHLCCFPTRCVDGYHYIFRVDPKALSVPVTWIFALGQAFFSLSVAGNGTLIYGSYLPDTEDVPASAARVAFFDTIAAMLAALVIIPAMATTGAQLDQGGPGLLFIYLPHLIKAMPGGRIIAIIFFAAVFLAGMSSLMNLYEAPIATIQEKTGLGRKASCLVIAAIGIVVSMLIQALSPTGWMYCPFTSALLVQVWQALCSSGPRQKICRKAGQHRP